MDKKELKKICDEATPADKWTGSSNYPFYATLNKPAPSLSKHEGEPRGKNFWRHQDVIFVITARNELPKLLEENEKLEKRIQELEHELEKNYNGSF